MILSAKKVLELNEKYNFIEQLSDREKSNPEGVGIDVRVSQVFRLTSDGFLGIEDRKSPDVQRVADIAKDKFIVLNPDDFVLVKTLEKVNLPAEKVVIEEEMKPCILMVQVYPRTSLHRSGIQFFGTKIDPGYSGELTFALKNVSSVYFKLELGARIANLVFHTVLGELSRPYEGQWQGGRVHTEGVEKQN